MRKRLSFTVLALCMALLLLPGTARAEEEIPTEGTCGETAVWTYDIDTKTLTISGSGEIGFSYRNFPWATAVERVEFDGDITSIRAEGFREFTNLPEIIIPDTVTEIGSFAFYACSKLSHVVIPASVTVFHDARWDYEWGFGQPIFADCPLSTAGPIGSSCDIEFCWTDSIPANAFLGCFDLKSVILPDGIKSIGEAAFGYNNSLTEIIIPDSVTFIDKEAFYGCKVLENLAIPANVIRINEDVFTDCYKLSNLSVDPKNKIYSSQDGALFNKEKIELIWCPRTVTSYTVPKTVTEIGYNAFYNCTNLTNVILPDGLEIIGSSAFENCTNLTGIILPDGLKTIGYSAFASCSSLVNLIVPNSVTQISPPLASGCTALTDVTLSGGIRAYYSSFLSGSTNIKTVRFSEGVVELNGIFSGFSNLETVYIPESTTKIGEDTFKNCYNLKTIYYSGTQAKWDQVEIAQGNQEISLATLVCSGTETPNNPNTPSTPDTPDTSPEILSLAVTDGGLGKKVTVTIESGHWLTIQTRRSGSISITSVRAPGSGIVELAFSSATGSSIQVWETEEEMRFENGVPTNRILATASRSL